MQVEKLIKVLQDFNPKDEVIFYHLKNHTLTNCELETVIETDLGVELTIEENEDEFIDFDKMDNSQKLAFLIERNGYIEDGTGLNEYGHEFRDDNGLALFIDQQEK